MARVTTLANQRTAPRWAGEFISPDCLIPGGAKVNPAEFFAEDSVLVKLNGAAAADAVVLNVDALTGVIPVGTNLYFGQSKEFARVTVETEEGDVTIAVEALPSALEDNDEARYLGGGGQPKSIPSGTLIGRTRAERDAGTGFGPAVVATDEEIYLTAFDVTDITFNDDVELYRHHSLVKENYLPGFAGLAAGDLVWIRANYDCIGGYE